MYTCFQVTWFLQIVSITLKFPHLKTVCKIYRFLLIKKQSIRIKHNQIVNDFKIVLLAVRKESDRLNKGNQIFFTAQAPEAWRAGALIWPNKELNIPCVCACSVLRVNFRTSVVDIKAGRGRSDWPVQICWLPSERLHRLDFWLPQSQPFTCYHPRICNHYKTA